MGVVEEWNIRHMFKLTQRGNVKKLIGQIFDEKGLAESGQNWKERAEELRLMGHHRSDLELADDFHATGNPRQARRSRKALVRLSCRSKLAQVDRP